MHKQWNLDIKKLTKSLICLVGIFKRSYVSGSFGIALHGKEPSQVPDALGKARKLGKKIALDIQRGRKYPLQNMLRRLFINLLIKPGFKKFITKDKETNTRAVYENLRMRELI